MSLDIIKYLDFRRYLQYQILILSITLLISVSMLTATQLDMFLMDELDSLYDTVYTPIPIYAYAQSQTDDPFLTTWETTLPNQTISIHVSVHSGGTLTIDWGDGSTATSVITNGVQSHTYATAGLYRVTMTGDLSQINLGDSDSTPTLLHSINQWGDIRWSTMSSAFRDASKMTYNATDAPNLSQVTDMSNMFTRASAFNGDLSDWDTSSVTSMRAMFSEASAFNGDLSDWDISSVKTMSDMFNSAREFNADISGWNTSSVTTMSYMFQDARAFNQDLSTWNTSSVTTMSYMFTSAFKFNGDISDWDTSSVVYMRYMFSAAKAFNQDISSWDVSSVTSMSYMFNNANAFNQNLGPWYITPDSVNFSYADSLNITDITPQNGVLAGQNPTYAIGTGGDSYLFEIVSGSDILAFKAVPTSIGVYNVTVTATGNSVFEKHNNHHMIQVTVSRIPIDPDLFVTTWKTTSPNQTIRIPVNVHSGGTLTIDWGDNGTTTTVNSNGVQSHTYATAGSYHVTMAGDLSRINLGGSGSTPTLLHSINQWGDIQWSTMTYAFSGASKMTYNATDAPDLSQVTDMSRMFKNTYAFNGDLSTWNTSSVTNMVNMFQKAHKFNGDISTWNTSSVTNMSRMFEEAHKFNGDISDWNTSSVTNMAAMFQDAPKFNRDLSDWDTSSVNTMYSMFNGAHKFNGDLSDWNTSSVYVMSHMFQHARVFNADISGWNVSLTGSMNSMFLHARAFNADISGWDTSSAVYMRNMFYAAKSFNQDISGWDVSSVSNMSLMFTRADKFNQNLGPWYITPDSVNFSYTDSLDVVDIKPQNGVLAGHNPTYAIGTSGDSDLFEIVSGSDTLAFKAAPTSTGVYNVTVTATGNSVFEKRNNHHMIQVTVSSIPIDDSSFLTTWETSSAGQEISIPVEVHSGKNFTINWGDGSTTATVNSNGTQSHTYATSGSYRVTMTGDLSRINLGGSGSTPELLYSIDQWGDIRWSTMNGAFRDASEVIYDATDAPNLSHVTDMSRMFQDASKFNGDLSDWNTSSVTDMSRMFSSASAFIGDLSDWNTSSVTDMSSMFAGASAFNGDLSTWNTSSVTDMSSMFTFASAFNGDISGWNTSSVTDMSSMFTFASEFTGDISGWNTSSVTTMAAMFFSASTFNENLATWNTSSVTDMSNMFLNAGAFNGDISSWDVSSVTAMSNMFNNANAFDQNLGPWYIAPDSVDFSYTNSLNVTDITPQNGVLAVHNPTYAIGTGGNFDLFEIVSGSDTLAFKAAPTHNGLHQVNVTATGDSVFENGNNHRMIQVTISGIQTDTTPPSITSILRSTTIPESTSATTLMFDVTFSEPVINVDAADFTVSGTGTGSVSNISGSGSSYIVTVDVTSNSGTIGLDLVSNNHGIIDSAGIALADTSPDPDETYTIDTISPSLISITRNSPTTETTSETSLDFAVTFSEPVTNVGPTDFVLSPVTGAGAGDITVSSVNTSSYVVTVAVTTAGTINLDVASNHDITDTAGNSLTTATAPDPDESFTVDTTQFTPSVNTNTPSPTNQQSITFKVDFDELIDTTTFTESDVYASQGIVSTPTTDNNQTFEFTITGLTAGPLVVYILADSVDDLAQNKNLVSNTVTITIDTTPPLLSSITRSSPTSELTSLTSLEFAVNFSEDVTNVGPADFVLSTVTGAGTGTITVSSVNTSSYVVTVADATAGTINLDVASNHDITDTAGNPLTTTTTPNPDESFTVDTTQFTPFISTDTQSPTNQQSITFTVDFGEPIDTTTFTESDVSTSDGTVSAPTTDNNQTFEFTITGLTAGTLTVSIPADSVDDLAQNKNLVSNTLTITIDTTSPSLSSITRSSPTSELTSLTSLEFAVNFSEDVTNVGPADFVLSTVTGAGTGTITVSSVNTSSYVVTVADATAGTINLDVASNHDITDTAGNSLTTVTAPNPDESFTVDTTQFTPSISTSVTSPTNQQSITFTVDFGEPIDPFTFTASDVSASQGTVSAPTTDNNQTFEFTITGLTAGTLTVSIPADSVHDLAENNNLISNTVTIEVGSATLYVTSITRSSPTLEITSDATPVFLVEFNTDVQNVDQSDFELSPDSPTDGYSQTFMYTSTPSLGIVPHNTDKTDTITVSASGTVSAVSVAVDITHDWRGDLLVQLVSPDNQIVTLHNRAGGSADNIVETYTLEYDDVVSISGDWQLRMNDNYYLDSGVLNSWTLTLGDGSTTINPISSVTGSGSQYYVTITAITSGIYNLDIAQDTDIVNSANIPLTSLVPANQDHSYNVTIVVDNVKPVITLTDSIVDTILGTPYVDAGATCIDDTDGDISQSHIQVDNPVNANIAGTYTVTFTCDDSAGNPAAPITRTVNVIDTPPTITSITRSDPADASTNDTPLNLQYYSVRQ